MPGHLSPTRLDTKQSLPRDWGPRSKARPRAFAGLRGAVFVRRSSPERRAKPKRRPQREVMAQKGGPPVAVDVELPPVGDAAPPQI
eukprot:9379639-Pyramimonas_sp.AAC.1